MSALAQQRDTASPPPERSGEFAPTETRVDPPHAPPTAEPVVESAEVAESTETPPQDYEQLLAQAKQIAEHLRDQCAEMDRREQRLHSQLALLDQERRNVRLWVSHFESQIHEREEALIEREAESNRKATACLSLEQELQRLNDDLQARQRLLTEERAKLQAEREAGLAEVKLAREHLDQWIAEARQELETERAECDAALAADRNRHRAQIDGERRDLTAERDQLTAELTQERQRLENRARFQEDHLQRVRHEFEAAQAAARLEHQQRQTELAELALQLDRRTAHLEHAREILDARTESLAREAEQLVRSRRMFEDAMVAERQALDVERLRLEEDRETQQSDLQRQQDLLAAHAENLETRRVRLDRLRAELEDTNHHLLEMRLAVEEAHAQFCQTVGQEVAQQRLEEARQLLAEFYRHTRDGLAAQRREMAEQESRIHTQTEDLQEQREALSRWMTEQEALLDGEREQLQAIRLELQVQDLAWRRAANQWAADKSEAEAVIRDLLQRLDGRE